MYMLMEMFSLELQGILEGVSSVVNILQMMKVALTACKILRDSLRKIVDAQLAISQLALELRYT